MAFSTGMTTFDEVNVFFDRAADRLELEDGVWEKATPLVAALLIGVGRLAHVAKLRGFI